MDKPPVKLSTKVLKELLTLLREGFFGDAETLPREEDLAKILQVSRTVIRDVLKILEQEGYIIRVKKKGLSSTARSWVSSSAWISNMSSAPCWRWSATAMAPGSLEWTASLPEKS